jgi:predicted PurR-regulated permease PerM
MSSSTSLESSSPLMPGWLMFAYLLKKLAIWGLFGTIIYIGRDFFFLGFMTFLFSYMALTVVQWTMNRFWPGQELPGRRKLITVGVFLFLPVVLFSVGYLLMPYIVSQAHHCIGWVSRTNPETEVAQMLEGMFGNSDFEQTYGGPQDPRFQKALAEFQKSGDRFVKQYLDFPKLESWIEGSFTRQYTASLESKLRTSLIREGVNSKAFADWFMAVYYPQAKAASSSIPGQSQDKKTLFTYQPEIQRLVASSPASEALTNIRNSPKLSAFLQEEWIDYSIDNALTKAKSSPAYTEQLKEHYEQLQKQKPGYVTYTFAEFLALQQARSQGEGAFSATMAKLRPNELTQNEAEVMADFKASKKHELFVKWWDTSSPARFIRHEIESHLSGNATDKMESMLTSLLNVPLDLTTALLLSFLICIDFQSMKRAVQSLRHTWLRDVYDEIVPALTSLAKLIGISMYAQGLIALCNATLVFFGLTFFGVDHAILLSVAVFVLCLIPTLGMILSWVLIVLVALLQPGGGMGLAIKATSLVAVVVILETFVFSPRILGKMMELHPVLIIAILPIAHAFFGIWGLLLAIPVAVYVINEVIFCHQLEHEEKPMNAV